MKTFGIKLIPFILAALITGCAETQKSEFFVFLNINPESEELSESQLEDLQENHLGHLDESGL